MSRDLLPTGRWETGVDALNERLNAWVDAGLITTEQFAAIAAYERQNQPLESPGPPEPPGVPESGHTDSPASPGDRSKRTTGAEAIGYVGAALALGAIGLILTDLWEQLLVGGRLALIAVLTFAVFGGGFVLRDTTSGAMRRLASVLFTASVAGAGWFAGSVAADVIDARGEVVAVSVGAVMVIAALPLYVWKRRALLQLALLVALMIAIIAGLNLAKLTPGAGSFGLLIGVLGAAWFLLGMGRWLEPRIVAEVAGALVLFVGVQVSSFGETRTVGLAVGVGLAALLVVVAIRSDQIHHLAIGAVALFIFSPQLVFEIFGDAIGAPAALLLAGLLLVLLAVGLGRARREVATSGTSEAGPQ